MTIQFNTDSSLTMHEEFRDRLKALISEELSNFSNIITRLEIHLSDQNSHKPGQNDKKCLIEARVEGRQPVAVTADAHDYEEAVDGAINKLKSMLETISGQASNH